MKTYVVVLLIFFAIITGIAFIFCEVILCHYHELPMDSHVLIGPSIEFDQRYDERIKQVWTYIYTPLLHSVLEIGFGNTTCALNISKRLPSTAKHMVVVPPERQENLEILNINKQITHTEFDISNEIPVSSLTLYETVIVHIDGQYTFWNHIKANNFDILKTAKVLILEVDVDLLKTLAPILTLNKYKKERTYIFLSVWYKRDVA